ncbi:MAG: two-component regulator propeller domain-containing protein, partial [Bacteroidota bacterium]
MALICFLLAGLGIARGQEVILQSFGIEDGLPSLNIYAIHLDDDGYLWVGTPEGLVQYDGDRFRLVEGHAKPGVYVMDIWHDREGTIWYRVVGGESYAYDGDSLREFPHNALIREFVDQATNRAVNATHLDEHGTLHLGFNGLGYLQIFADGSKKLMDRHSHPTGYYIREIGGELFDYGIQNPDTAAPFYTRDLYIDRDGFSFRYQYEYDARFQMVFLRSCYALRDGRILVVTGNHVLEVFPDQTYQEHFFPSPIYHVLEDASGRLLFSFLIGGTRAYDPQLRPLKTQFSQLDGSRLGMFLDDRQGGFWVKGSNQGLYHLRSLDILRFGADGRSKAAQVSGICHDAQRNVFYATADGAIMRLPAEGAPEEIAHLPADGSMGTYVQAMCFDTVSGSLLMSTNSFNAVWQDGKLQGLPSHRGNSGLAQIIDMGNGEFVGWNSRRVVAFPYGNNQERPAVAVEPARFLPGGCRDRDGRVWITRKDSVLIYEGDSLRTVQIELPADQSLVFWNANLAADGRLLIGSGRPGLLVMDGEDPRWVGPSEGLPDDITLGAFTDAKED